MHAAEEIVDAEIGHDERKESQNHEEVVVGGLSQPRKRAVVKRYGIDHQRDERPCLFRVPAPIGAPRDVGPDGSREDTKAETGDGWIQEQLR